MNVILEVSADAPESVRDLTIDERAESVRPKEDDCQFCRCHEEDNKAHEALKAVKFLIDYLDEEEEYCSDIYWVDSKGYVLHTDIGYFFEGLTGLADLLEARCSDGEVIVKEEEK